MAEPWLLLTLGASSFLIGLDTFAMNAPVWLLILVGGALADRSDRRHVIALFQSIQMLCPVAIVVLLATGRIHPWMIIVLSVVVGVTDALSMPSFQSIVPSLVTRPQIGRGLALNSTQFNLSRILGPSIAGVLIAGFGAMACFVVSAASYIPFIGVALWILPRRTAELALVTKDKAHTILKSSGVWRSISWEAANSHGHDEAMFALVAADGAIGRVILEGNRVAALWLILLPYRTPEPALLDVLRLPKPTGALQTFPLGMRWRDPKGKYKLINLSGTKNCPGYAPTGGCTTLIVDFLSAD